ncbi:guanine nucleotide-binding protein subunit alpha [Tulasnella sp. JGI-2019a]|nr:guanine nucleotide-binding protein subunit alpha [Tulasnella sp. JGI-2019a]
MGCVESKAVRDDRNEEDGQQHSRSRDGNATSSGMQPGSSGQHMKEIKMLLLGAGDSGKTTILKQMKLNFEGGYNDRERKQHKDAIFSITIQSMRSVLLAMPILNVPIQPGNESRKAQILGLSPSITFPNDYLPKEISDALRGLWYDPGVRAVVNRSREYQLNDSASYFFHALERMAAPGYLPTDQDILRSRVKTTGIVESVFHVGEVTYRVFDVGGQRSERKKWIHCFDNVAALVFLVSLSEYDQKLYEDEKVNRMTEALTLFDSISNSRWFINTQIIVFFNKIDIFAEKLPRSPLTNFFPDYTGDNEDYPAACDFIKNKFLSMYRGEEAAEKLHSFLTCATDSRQIQMIMDSVQEILLMANLRGAGIL